MSELGQTGVVFIGAPGSRSCASEVSRHVNDLRGQGNKRTEGTGSNNPFDSLRLMLIYVALHTTQKYKPESICFGCGPANKHGLVFLLSIFCNAERTLQSAADHQLPLTLFAQASRSPLMSSTFRAGTPSSLRYSSRSSYPGRSTRATPASSMLAWSAPCWTATATGRRQWR